jgi:glycosyltransferase involved in cell wall biosynthesis
MARLHILGLPHTQTHPAFNGCAFTAKVLKFIKMMSGRGHRLIHYGHQLSQIHSAPDVEHVTVVDDAVHRAAYGDAYVDQQQWRELGFAHYYRSNDLAHQTFHANAIKEIGLRKQPNDFILCFWGWGVKPVADAHPDLIAVEPGIGNGAAFARWRVYESHSVRMAVGGIDAVNYCNQDWYHVVINNYFDPEDFTYNTRKDSYVLYLGRIGYNKGVDIAVEATAAAGKRLIVAGQGSLRDLGYTRVPDHVVEVGYADAEMRRMLMAKASALFIASRYGEPFGGVQVEAWMSGTPVITPDWAAFAELNQHGETGFRCRTFDDFVTAIDQAPTLDPARIRSYAQRFSLDSIAPQYDRYFTDVLNVYTGQGWYTRSK